MLTRWISRTPQEWLAAFPRCLAETWIYCSLGLLVIIVLRSLSGDLNSPLDFLPSAAWGLVIAVYSYALRHIGPECNWLRLTPLQWQAKIACATGLLLAALSIRGSTTLGLLVLWLPWIYLELHWWLVRMEPVVPSLSASAFVSTALLPSHESDIDLEAEWNEQDATAPGELLAEMRRVRLPEGEMISGTFALEFAVGQQVAFAHLIFQPPFATVPELLLEPLDGESLTLKAAEVRSYGARIEAKRPAKQTMAACVKVAYEALTPFD